MPDPIYLHWESDTKFIAKFGQPEPMEATLDDISSMRKMTSMYLQALSSRVQGPSQDFVALFVPPIPQEQLRKWTQQYNGYENALDLYSRETCSPEGIIRDMGNYGQPYLFRR
jgi:hypothetical protein